MGNLQGVPVLGYLFWTISDNWEWADGYGPKFGLVAVDRSNNLARIPRPSYNLFTKVLILICAIVSFVISFFLYWDCQLLFYPFSFIGTVGYSFI